MNVSKISTLLRQRGTAFALAAAALAAVPAVLLGAGPASAGTLSTAVLQCDAITGRGATIGLPYGSSYGIESRLYTSVDHAAWGVSDWFYTQNGREWDYRGGAFVSMYAGELLSVPGTTPGNHEVTAWELQYVGGQYHWNYLGSCATSSGFAPGSANMTYNQNTQTVTIG